MSTQNKKSYLLCFGTLKKNCKNGYNYQRFGGQEFVKDFILKGYKMVNLGYYPAIYKDNTDSTIQCEFHEVDKDSMDYIRRMERGAGYDEEIINVDGQDASLFVMNKSKIDKYEHIDTGNWE